MSISQKVTEVSVDHRIVLKPCTLGFPAAWLEPDDEKYVIDRAHWNTEPAPAHQPLMLRACVQWNEFYGTRDLIGRKSYGVELGALIVRLYFGVIGCIVPVSCFPQFDNDVLVFTLAEATKLLRYSPGFSSVADFHLNRMLPDKCTRVSPVVGGEEATEAALIKCGYWKPRNEEEWAFEFKWVDE
ncbi:hypothetical protein FB451DRAFT_1559439 [Mycena latifolia]|nr:hypothetical protein FB451DRAFT_1559439 [Mycena latifolia]